jgi:hypothetical protein
MLEVKTVNREQAYDLMRRLYAKYLDGPQAWQTQYGTFYLPLNLRAPKGELVALHLSRPVPGGGEVWTLLDESTGAYARTMRLCPCNT